MNYPSKGVTLVEDGTNGRARARREPLTVAVQYDGEVYVAGLSTMAVDERYAVVIHCDGAGVVAAGELSSDGCAMTLVITCSVKGATLPKAVLEAIEEIAFHDP